MTSCVLQDKVAVVFGAGGSIGAAVAREFAREGAEVFLAGRTKSSVDSIAQQIVAAGGKAHAAHVDVLDNAAVNAYVDGVVKQAGRLGLSRAMSNVEPEEIAP